MSESRLGTKRSTIKWDKIVSVTAKKVDRDQQSRSQRRKQVRQARQVNPRQAESAMGRQVH